MAKKAKSKHWSEAEAARILDEADASGLSDTAYGPKAGVTSQRLSWWRQRLGRRRPRSGAKVLPVSTFVEVRVREKAAVPEIGQARERREIEIRLANGRSVVVPASLDLELLGRLLATVDATRC
jgi:hypothetical protein